MELTSLRGGQGVVVVVVDVEVGVGPEGGFGNSGIGKWKH